MKFQIEPFSGRVVQLAENPVTISDCPIDAPDHNTRILIDSHCPFCGNEDRR